MSKEVSFDLQLKAEIFLNFSSGYPCLLSTLSQLCSDPEWKIDQKSIKNLTDKQNQLLSIQTYQFPSPA